MPVSRNFDINPYSYALTTSRTTDPNAILTRNFADFNIFDELDNNYIDIGVTDLKFQGEISWKPIVGLSFNAIGSFRYNESTQNHYVKDRSNQAQAYRAGIIPENATIRASNKFLYTNPDVPNSLPMTVLPQGGILYNTTYAMSQYDFRAIGQYNKEFNGEHLMNVMAGFEAGKIERHTQSFQGWGICYENGNIPFTDWHLFKQMSEENGNYFSDSYNNNRSLAYFGTASYSYRSRYIINGTIRYEGSNKLGKSSQSRWLPTWNVSGAWNADAEEWFQNPVLATAKLRLSYSLTADGGPANVSNATAIYYPSRPWRQEDDSRELGIELYDLANSELTYEKKHELDIGVDLGFLNNRINLSFDWYKRDNFDLIGYVFTQGVGGINTKLANNANLASHGVEFTLTTHNIQGRDLSWTTDWHILLRQNKITNLQSRLRVIDQIQGSGLAIRGLSRARHLLDTVRRPVGDRSACHHQ